MSLLDSGAKYEECLVYLEEVSRDRDGNTRTQPSETGVPAKARFDILGQSGTSSRRQEQDNEGFETEKVYSIRFSRESERRLGPIGAQSRLEWRGEQWHIFGDVNRYTRSRRTSHTTYTVKRF